jgi:hypothetical protein
MMFQWLLPAMTLAVLVGCGGAATAPGADVVVAPVSKGMVYSDPTGSLGYTLVRDASSTDNHLVLNLVGPDGQKGRGVGFNLQSDGSIAFAKFNNGIYVRDLGVFQLSTYYYGAYTSEPVLVNGGVKQNGTLLTVGVFQKDRYLTSKVLSQPLLQIAIDFDTIKTAALAPGTRIPLSITKAKAIPAFIGVPPMDPTDPQADWSSVVAYYNASLVPVDIAVGTLVTK